jgi:F-type H+-transporting ATPase subunit b
MRYGLALLIAAVCAVGWVGVAPVYAQDDAAHADADSDAADAAHADDAGQGDEHAATDHDRNDLSHGNASDAIEDLSELKADLAIWTLVVFLCLLALLAKFAWGPVIGGLDQREQAISDKIDEAKRSAEQAAEQLRQYEAKLAAASEEATAVVAGARKDAEAAKDRIMAEAQTSAERERQRAIEDISAAKNVALQEITERSVDLAEAMASRLLKRELQAQDRAQLVKEALEQLPSRN